MIDTSVSPCDLNRLFRSGVITYYMPSGKHYMRTIGKQKIEAAEEDKNEPDGYEGKLYQSLSAIKNIKPIAIGNVINGKSGSKKTDNKSKTIRDTASI